MVFDIAMSTKRSHQPIFDKNKDSATKRLSLFISHGNLCIKYGKSRTALLKKIIGYGNILLGGDSVKISINVDPELTDTEIIINCGSLTAETESIIAALRMADNQLTVIKDGETHILDISKIAYIETVDRRTFVYTETDCYESKLKLYEMVEKLCSGNFLRISKSCIVRLKYIRSLKADLDRRIRITLENGEQLIASRQYADELKKRLGVR